MLCHLVLGQLGVGSPQCLVTSVMDHLSVGSPLCWVSSVLGHRSVGSPQCRVIMLGHLSVGSQCWVASVLGHLSVESPQCWVGSPQCWVTVLGHLSVGSPQCWVTSMLGKLSVGWAMEPASSSLCTLLSAREHPRSQSLVSCPCGNRIC